MPILWQPGVTTNLTASPPAYTLVVIATQDIDVGVVLSFRMWDGLNYTYEQPGGTLISFDVAVEVPIPASTQLTVSMRPSGTALFALNGITKYSSTGTGVPIAFQYVYASLICLAFVPTGTGSFLPAYGQPQFAIGFSYQPTQQGDCTLGSPPLIVAPANATAPNFPDQFSAAVNPWEFKYEVVYPTTAKYVIADVDVCYQIYGIKFKAVETYATGSWSNLREVISQPLTVIQHSYETINNWVPYSTLTTVTLPPNNENTAVMGPFTYAVAEGQLAVVYFRPLPGAYPVLNAAQTDKSPAEVAFVLTAPIPANVSVYITTQGYDADYLGYGPRDPSGGAFISTTPSCVWTTGSDALRAGTVILMSGFGNTAAPTGIVVQDAHNPSANVGAVTGWTVVVPRLPVVSFIFLGAWELGVPQRFITAVLSSQYVGDFPLLSPALTIQPAPFTFPSIYGQGKVFTNLGLPGTVQSPMINSGAFVTLDWNTVVDPTTLPTFLNMNTFSI
jgi:hypothetical protein